MPSFPPLAWLSSLWRSPAAGNDGVSSVSTQQPATATPCGREALQQQLADALAQLQRQQQQLEDQTEWQRRANAFVNHQAQQAAALQARVRSLQADLNDETAATERVRERLDAEGRRSGALEAQLRAAEAQLASRGVPGAYDLAAATPDALLVAADDAADAVRAAAHALLAASEALLGSKQAARATWAPLVGFDSPPLLRLWLEGLVAQVAFPDTFGTHMHLMPGCSCFAGAGVLGTTRVQRMTDRAALVVFHFVVVPLCFAGLADERRLYGAWAEDLRQRSSDPSAAGALSADANVRRVRDALLDALHRRLHPGHPLPCAFPEQLMLQLLNHAAPRAALDRVAHKCLLLHLLLLASHAPAQLIRCVRPHTRVHALHSDDGLC
jgi:hypothetical protein